VCVPIGWVARAGRVSTGLLSTCHKDIHCVPYFIKSINVSDGTIDFCVDSRTAMTSLSRACLSLTVSPSLLPAACLPCFAPASVASLDAPTVSSQLHLQVGPGQAIQSFARQQQQQQHRRSLLAGSEERCDNDNQPLQIVWPLIYLSHHGVYLLVELVFDAARRGAP
jgi:hypothetical protein